MKTSLLDALYKSRERKRRKLVDIDVDEISLVDKAASGHSFAIVKADDGADLLELMEAYESPEFVSLLKAGDEGKLRAALVKALEILKPYLPDMPEVLEPAIKLIGSYIGAAAGGNVEPGKDKALYSDADVEERLSTVNKSAGSDFSALLSEIARVHCPRAYEKIFKRADPDEGEALTLDELAEFAEAHGLELKPRNGRAVKKSLDGQNDDAIADEAELWPSLSGR